MVYDIPNDKITTFAAFSKGKAVTCGLRDQ